MVGDRLLGQRLGCWKHLRKVLTRCFRDGISEGRFDSIGWGCCQRTGSGAAKLTLRFTPS
jgi:hypothetical protein